MRILLDTHVLLWWLADDDRLGRYARTLLENPGNDILVSVASLWEVVVKVRIGKLEADVGEIAAAVQDCGFALLDISVKHLSALASLPMHHRDPFDRLLIAQAAAEDAALLSDDRSLRGYPARVLRCSG